MKNLLDGVTIVAWSPSTVLTGEYLIDNQEDSKHEDDDDDCFPIFVMTTRIWPRLYIFCT